MPFKYSLFRYKTSTNMLFLVSMADLVDLVKGGIAYLSTKKQKGISQADILKDFQAEHAAFNNQNYKNQVASQLPEAFGGGSSYLDYPEEIRHPEWSFNRKYNSIILSDGSDFL